MPIKLKNSRQPGVTHAALIKEIIRIGKEVEELCRGSRFYADLWTREAIGATIRKCNSDVLGMPGSSKNGCLYREAGLNATWSRDCGENVVCDHAVPVVELVRQYIEEKVPIEKLIFSPVVRIRKSSDDLLRSSGLVKTGFKEGYPLHRYSRVGLKLVTHMGQPIDPATWTDDDHWGLVHETEELKPVLSQLDLRG